MGVFRDIIDAIGHTPIVEVRRLSPSPSVRIYCKLEGHNPFGSLKDRIAKYMIERAEREGKLTKDKVILEPTSGNTGIALALIAKKKGYKFVAVLPENVSPERVKILRICGAEVITSPAQKGTDGAIELAFELAKDPKYFMPFQFGNEANPLAHYETTANEILNDVPQVDIFVAGIGTGGTIMGVGRRLKEVNPEVKIVGVIPKKGEQIEGLRSLHNFIPPILDLGFVDKLVEVEAKDAFIMARRLLDIEGIFAGISSGAVIYCVLQLVGEVRKGNIVVILPDGGWKYVSSKLWTCPIEFLEKIKEPWKYYEGL